MKHTKLFAVLGLFVLTIIVLFSTNVLADCEIGHYIGTATIDGDNSEWNHETTPASGEMYEAFKPDHPVLSKFWLRYDCEEEDVMYVLVMAENKIVVQNGVHVWLKLDGTKVVSSDPTGEQEFAWVGSDGKEADGWEASFPLVGDEFDFEIHNNALDADGKKQSSGLDDVQLCIDCDPISIELSSFEAYTCTQGIQIEWEVAAEISHAGYNVYRGESENGDFVKINSELVVSTNDNSDGHYKFLDPGARADYYYQLEEISLDGQSTFFGPIQVSGTTGTADTPGQPIDYNLTQNYPNPFNPKTSISYSLPVSSEMILSIYNVQGKRVKTLVNSIQTAGNHTVTWDGTNDAGELIPSGIYIYQMTAGDFQKFGRMTLLK